MSEVELPISGEGTLEAELDDGSSECTLEMSEYSTSPEAEDTSQSDADTEAESACDPEEESMTAGLSATNLQAMPAWDSAGEENMNALESMTPYAGPPPIGGWKNLLAAVAAQAAYDNNIIHT